MIDRLKKLIGKKVFLQISGNRMYNGIIQEISEDMIQMTDKYNELIFIAISEIKFIQEKS
jgi:small nuclear ribonucleoprotein (snRNP)-like protein